MLGFKQTSSSEGSTKSSRWVSTPMPPCQDKGPLEGKRVRDALGVSGFTSVLTGLGNPRPTISSLWALMLFVSFSIKVPKTLENFLGLGLFANLFERTLPFGLSKLIFMSFLEKCLTHSQHFMPSTKLNERKCTPVLYIIMFILETV